VDPKFDPLPSSYIISSSLYFYSLGEIIDSSNQEAKKKNKTIKKTKKNKKGGSKQPFL